METGYKLQVSEEGRVRAKAEEWDRLYEEIISPEVDKSGLSVHDVARSYDASPPDGWGSVYHVSPAQGAQEGLVVEQSDQVPYCGDCCIPLDECGH